MIPHVDNASTDFIVNVGATVTPIVMRFGTSPRAIKLKYVPLDIDVFPMGNSGSKKEGVSYTYKGFNGYAPLAAYLGQEGWCLACELRPGSQHGQMEFIHFLERVRAARQTADEAPAAVPPRQRPRRGREPRLDGAPRRRLHHQMEPAPAGY